MGKLLVVDDNKQNCEIMEGILTEWGHQVYTADEGIKAFNLAYKFDFHCILMDIFLPGMNGFELCKKLKNNISTMDTPVIIVTSLNEVEDRIRGFNSGADVFLSRPIMYEELKNRIDWAINSKRMLSNTENMKNVVKSYLNLMKAKDENLYMHCCTVKNYCEKVGKLLPVKDESIEKLLIAAYLHDIGKLVSNSFNEHIEAGIEIISPLKTGEWLTAFIRDHHVKKFHNETCIEIKILSTINYFIELSDYFGSKEKGLSELNKECVQGYWSVEVLEAMKQVLKDELFIQSINYSL